MKDFTTISWVDGKWQALGIDPNHPEPDQAKTTPSQQDKQFNPNPSVSRKSEGKFYIQDLVGQPNKAHQIHTLTAECSYCHKTIEIELFAPRDAQNFVKDEARRLGLLMHFRTEDHKPKRKQRTTAS